MSRRTGLIDLRPLGASVPFRNLWLSGVLGSIGAQVTVVAVLFQVWDLTRNPFWVGAIGLAQAVPMVVLGLVGGPLADVFDRRRIALWSTAGQATAALGLAGQLVLGPYPLPLLLGLVSLQTACSALGAPARRTFTIRLLPRHLVAAGIALHMVAFQATMLVGPALGGLIIAAASVGLCYLVNAVALTVSWLAVRTLPPILPGTGTAPPVALEPSDTPTGHPVVAAEGVVPEDDLAVPGRISLWARTRRGLALLAEGVQQISSNPVLRGSFLLDLAATLLAFPVGLFPMVNQAMFDGDPRTLGLFLTALAVGGLTAGLWSGLVTSASRLGRVQLFAVGAWGVGMLGFALAAWAAESGAGVADGGWPAHLAPWAVLGFLVLAGAADTVSVTSRAAMVQLATADRHLGRVSAVEHVIGVAGPDVGNSRAGAVAGLTTPAMSALIGALTCLAASAWVALTHRQIAGFRVEGSS